MAREIRERSFDELARGLAEGSISRRRALGLFASSAIAALIPSTKAMAAITCPPGQVKICHVPQRADGTCRRGEAETRCVSPENAARHASHPCDCCGGCGGTDNCREPKPRTCFSTSTTSTTPMCIPLSNGTCAKPCGGGCLSGPCGSFPCGCFCDRNFCGDVNSQGNSCSNDMDCPVGTFCSSEFCRTTSC